MQKAYYSPAPHLARSTTPYDLCKCDVIFTKIMDLNSTVAQFVEC